ncbi:MAG: undecaprenyldiphospho-muramoylpentapeptide beta-N-acetylglucosaminyltransferase [Pseudomonadota bacterium]
MIHAVFTGGGTAGHVMPALPIMQRLRHDGHRVTFIGGRSGFEANLVADQVDAFHGIPAGKLRRYWSWANLRDVFLVLAGCLAALWLLARLRPQIVFSKGGFVTLPVVFAAWCFRVPVIAHESDASPGLANRLAYPMLAALCTSFERSADELGFRGPLVFTGTPVRDALLSGDAAAGRRYLRLRDDRPVLLVTGGSLGADRLNAVVVDAAAELTREFQLVHVCGRGKTPPRSAWPKGYTAHEFIGDAWGDVLASADFVVSRAGANTLFELLTLRIPHLLVPLSARVSRGDQIQNARYAEAQGFSRVLDDDALTAATLVTAVAEEFQQRGVRQQQLDNFPRADATGTIVALLLEHARSG